MAAASDSRPVNPGRRRLLKVGLAGAAALALVPLFMSRGDKKLAEGFHHLREPDVDFWRAVIPALLAGVLPEDAGARKPLVDEILHRIDLGMALLRPSLRRQTIEMLDFLQTAPAHGLSGGYWGDWRDATIQDATAVLHSWSTSRTQLMRACYRSVHDFVMGSWYAMPQSWPAIGYPGPPVLGASGASS
jgi:hypothetical protein